MDLKINQLQNSSGVMSDEDQTALNGIETASKQLLQTIAELILPTHESVQHQEAVRQDRQVRPGETPAEHSSRMQRDYPGGFYDEANDLSPAARIAAEQINPGRPYPIERAPNSVVPNSAAPNAVVPNSIVPNAAPAAHPYPYPTQTKGK